MQRINDNDRANTIQSFSTVFVCYSEDVSNEEPVNVACGVNAKL